MKSGARLTYLPLGGAGEIGMNCYVYGYGAPDAERFIVVDLGVTFPSAENSPGVDLIIPNIDWLAERADRIDGIFITHAHEDHIGGLALIYDRIPAPVFARKFTAANARRKMEERGRDPEAIITVEAHPEVINVGDFSVSYVPVPHSIPESSGLLIKTPGGKIMHTGDFKLDPKPLVGEPYDPELWAATCGPDLDVLVCDSTNVFSPQPGRSEASLPENIEALFRSAKGMVVATTFASNVARLKTLADAAIKADRSVVLLGRAMRRMVETAAETGVLTDFPSVISVEDALSMPRDHVFMLSTGSQGERRASSAQLSNGKYRGVTLKAGDMFLFSSKTIPGNELGVTRILNNFSEMGVDVVDDTSGHYHVSGHANRPDIEELHKLLKPRIVIPMHGEHRHLREHCALAKSNGFKSAIVPNGTMIDLSGKKPITVGYVETGRSYLDGALMIEAMDGIVRNRLRMSFNGHVAVAVIIDEDDEPLSDVWVACHGLANPRGGSLDEIVEGAVSQTLSISSSRTVMDDDHLEKAIIKSVRNSVGEAVDKKPEVSVLISRLMV